MAYQFTQTGQEIQDILDLSRNGIAEEYDPAQSYIVGNFCTYEDGFYVCTGATSGAWDATKWSQTTVGDSIPSPTSGTWTPTVSRANLDSASGTWVSVGGIVFLYGKLEFSATQTLTSSVYIDGTSLPAVVPASVQVSGAGSTAGDTFAMATYANKNVWIGDTGAGRIGATSLVSATMYFGLIAIPR